MISQATSKKRVKRLLLPCFIFSITYKVLLLVISESKIFSWEFEKPSSLLDLLCFLLEPANPQFYFLLYLFFISVFAYFVFIFLKKISTFFLFLILLGGYTLFYLYNSPLTSGYGPDLALIPIYTLAFFMGIFNQLINAKKASILLLFAFLICFITLTLCVTKNSYIYVYILIPLPLFYLVKQMQWLNKLMNLTQLGQKSAAIYVWHQPLIMPFSNLLANKLSQNDFIEVSLTLIFTIGMCRVADFSTRRFSVLRLWRF